jgi:hypothetical protein
MTVFTVTKVRKEASNDGTHRHIEGVCVESGTHFTRKQVVDSINAVNTWKSSAGGYSETIETISYCPKSGCMATPYIKTKPDSTKLDNLESLPSC